LVALLTVICILGVATAEIPNVPVNGATSRGVGTVNFTWAANQTTNETNTFNISYGGTWSNQTLPYILLSGSSGTVVTIYVYAWNSSYDGNLSATYLTLSDYYGYKTSTSAVPPVAIVPLGIIAAVVLFFALRRRKNQIK